MSCKQCVYFERRGYEVVLKERKVKVFFLFKKNICEPIKTDKIVGQCYGNPGAPSGVFSCDRKQCSIFELDKFWNLKDANGRFVGFENKTEMEEGK